MVKSAADTLKEQIIKRHSPRKGFSLMDATVTLVIVAIVLGLTVPAIQAAREQARARSCSDNLKHIALGLQNYHDVFKRFPAGAMHAGRVDVNLRIGPAWWYGMLPFLSEQSMFEQIGYPKGPFNAQEISATKRHELLGGFKPAFMHCPTSPLPVMWQASGPIYLPTYVGIAGGCDIRADSSDYQAASGTTSGLVAPKMEGVYNNPTKGTAPYGGIMTSSGMLAPNQWVRLPDCLDGTSNTMVVGEQGDWLRDVDSGTPGMYHGDPGWDPQGTAGTGPLDGGGSCPERLPRRPCRP